LVVSELIIIFALVLNLLKIELMPTIKTVFAGLELNNPFIVSSSGLTDSPSKNKALCQAGAGAIVLKSLFQEQIVREVAHMTEQEGTYFDGADYLEAYLQQHKLDEYLTLIKESKKVCSCPIIASINCFDKEGWMNFAQQIELAGADALEINTLALQTEIEYTYGSFEQKHIEILSSLKKVTKLPIIMKLGDNLSNPVALINQLYAHGAAAVVLFNRFYQPDIDIEKMEQTHGSVFSHIEDFGNTLRWVGITSAAVKRLPIAASGGVHTPENMVKAILAGAAAVEVCTAVYKNGAAFISQCTEFLSTWMEKKGFNSLEDFKGKLNQSNVQNNSTFERTQFLRYFSSRKN